MKTEAINPLSDKLDELSTVEMVQLFNKNDQDVLRALDQASEQIAQVIELVVKTIKNGGKVLYFGAGTSGRLGVLDAVECPPTFSTDKSLFLAFLAGGEGAMFQAVEGAEDNYEAGYTECLSAVQAEDIVFGLSASGYARYVHGALVAAKEQGALTVAMASHAEASSFQYADQKIILDTGAEILSGSTRLKAGTAFKLCLNTISTASMVKLGKTFGNLMVDVKVSNEKLKARATRLVSQIAEVDEQKAARALADNHNQVKVAIVALKKQLSYQQALNLLDQQDGFLKKALS